ncbi:hypothetical protein [Pseudonocardia acidicola]|uniref:DUF4436 domain-containing protein n=1 Tax=Pseudonocardia acidicola TaxID=2724939 RepID=A0ABX1SGN9_9PSEU|nr:hypothetical protein [Pseudonocardia acidicola]NMI00735.1 hypothetical protein [Pseudonocardia acidicola]
MRRFVVSLLTVISAVCLVLTSTALWAHRYVADTEGFVSGARMVLAEPAVRAWVGSRVRDTVVNPVVRHAGEGAAALLPPELQSFRPAIEGGVRSMLGEGVRSVPASDAFPTAALASAQAQLASGRPVTLSLAQVMSAASAQNPIGPVAHLLDLLPDDIGVVVLTPQDAPQLYTAFEVLQVLWLWTGLLMIATLAGALVLSRRPLCTVRTWAVTASVLAVLVLIALPMARASVLAHVEPAGLGAAGAVYGVLAGNLRTWTLWLFAGATVVAVATLRTASRHARWRAHAPDAGSGPPSTVITPPTV